MKEPVSAHDGNKGAADNPRTTGDIEGKLSLKGTIKIPIAKTEDSSNLAAEPNHRPKTSVFNIVSGIVSIICSIGIGLLLAGVGYLQYTVYTQQAKIMEADHRPWLAIRRILPDTCKRLLL